MKQLAKYFFQGIAYTVPIAVTVYVLIELFAITDSLLPTVIPGLGILILAIAVTAIGFVGSFLISLPLFDFLEGLLNRTPLIKIIYSSVKDLVNAFVGQKKSFDKPVLVQLYENSAIRRVGFMTDSGLQALQDKSDSDLVSVYLPHSFAISGQLFLVPPAYVTPLEGKSAEVMKYIIAGGVSSDKNGNSSN
ncbi:MAG: DUF502 domain-containing protein [Schleiferiaceae bacterium]|nr:DUF502 domain-containing protein [Schleiferiaceae bacterium]